METLTKSFPMFFYDIIISRTTLFSHLSPVSALRNIITTHITLHSNMRTFLWCVTTLNIHLVQHDILWLPNSENCILSQVIGANCRRFALQ